MLPVTLAFRCHARLGLLCLVTALAACAAIPLPGMTAARPSATACHQEREIVLPVRVINGALLVPVAINNIPVLMQLDTGSTSSVLEMDVAARLALPPDPHNQTKMHGIGGDILTRNAMIRSLGIGGSEWQSMSIATGHLPRGDRPTEPPIAGLLGADELAAFDVELDVPNGRMALWHTTNCEGDFVPWSVPHFVIPLARHNPNRMIAQVEVDGHPVSALVDWGARVTILSAADAGRVGVTPSMLARDRSAVGQGIDQTPTTFRAHSFDEIRVGAEVIHHPEIEVADLQLREVGMLLGADYALSRRIWLSYATRQMFVALPNASASR